VNSEKAELFTRLQEIANMFGATYSQFGEYPAWEYRKDSALRDTMVQVYTEQFGVEPQVIALHAGLECGLFSEKVEGLDCVSIGPQMYDIHTSHERLEIASAERTWKFLLEVLKAL
jgi:dipeptidase D